MRAFIHTMINFNTSHLLYSSWWNKLQRIRPECSIWTGNPFITLQDNTRLCSSRLNSKPNIYLNKVLKKPKSIFKVNVSQSSNNIRNKHFNQHCSRETWNNVLVNGINWICLILALLTYSEWQTHARSERCLSLHNWFLPSHTGWAIYDISQTKFGFIASWNLSSRRVLWHWAREKGAK